MAAAAKKNLSIVVPIHNEEDNIRPLMTRLMNVLNSLEGYMGEVIFVNDGSRDQSSAIIEHLISEGMPAVLIQLSRNYGHQAALEAGITHAAGDIIITMDGDQQHPPEYIPKMIEAYEQGADVVQMKRVNVGEDFKGKLSLWYYWFFNLVSEYPIVPNAADFRLMNRRVVQEILKIKVKGKFLRVLLPAVGFNQVYLEYVQEKRVLGSPSYTYYSLSQLAFHMLFKFTKAPINGIMLLGILMSAGSMLYLIYLLIYAVGTSSHASTVHIVITVFMLLTGMLLVGFAVLGWYLFLIIEQLRGEPDYIISYIRKA